MKAKMLKDSHRMTNSQQPLPLCDSVSLCLKKCADTSFICSFLLHRDTESQRGRIEKRGGLLRVLNLLLGCFFFYSATIAMAEEGRNPTPLLPVTRVSLSLNDKLPAIEQELPLTLRYDQRTLKGWQYLIGRLTKQGFSEKKLVSIFADSRMPSRDTLYFSLKPQEGKHRYRHHLTSVRRKNAVAFYHLNRKAFDEASIRYSVPKSILLSFLQVETNCGRLTGKSSVLYRLSRLASAGAPEDIEKNYRKKKKADKKVLIHEVASRAKELEAIFLPHTAATLLLAAEKKLDPFEIRGSSAGAIGIPQFLPGNSFLYGVDGNNDGEVDLFNDTDAIFSLANFLANHGWKKTISYQEKRDVIWAYNRSKAYVDTILQLAAMLEKDISPQKKS